MKWTKTTDKRSGLTIWTAEGIYRTHEIRVTRPAATYSWPFRLGLGGLHRWFFASLTAACSLAR